MSNQVLVTGGCGYIGSHVCRQLAERGQPAVVVDNLCKGFREALVNNETLYVGDVGDQELLARIFAKHRIGTVMHFAAHLVVPESVADPIKYYRNNTMGTLNLLTAATKAGVPRLIFSSTAATYGQPRQTPVLETDPQVPESPYGASKLMSERMLIDIAAATGLKYVILRYFNVAGADPGCRIGQRTPDATHLVKIATEVATGKRASMAVFGTDYPTRDGTCIRDYIHVEDLASAHLAALDHLERAGDSDVFNCGYGRGSTVFEVIRAVEEVAGRKLTTTTAPRRAGDVTEVVAGNQKIRDKLRWQPKYDDLKKICSDALAWERKLRGG